MKRQAIIGNKIFFSLLAICAVVLGSFELSGWQKRQKIESEIAEVQAQAKEYERKNKELSDSLVFLGTTAARERIARQQLNMKKEGEIAISFPAETKISQTNNETSATTVSNTKQWWNYFFGVHNN